MQINIEAVLGSIGLGDIKRLPHKGTCPLCHTQGLEVVGPTYVVCRKCCFVGDTIRLVAAANKQPVEAAVAELRAKGLLTYPDDVINTYLTEAAVDTQIYELHNKLHEAFKQQPSSLRAAMAAYGGSLHRDDALRLGYSVVLVKKEILEEHFGTSKETKRVLSQLKGFTAVGVATWMQAKLVGYWIFTATGFCAYLPLLPYPGVMGGLAVNLGADCAVIMDSPEYVLRLWLRGIRSEQEPLPVVAPAPGTSYLEWLPSRNIVYFSPEDNTSHYRGGIKHYGAKAVLASRVRYNPLSDTGTVRGFIKQLEDAAEPIHSVYAAHLLQRPQNEARALATASPLEAPDQAICLASVNGHDYEELRRIFEGTGDFKTIEWNGKPVTETPTGWVSGKTIITDAVIRLEEIRVGDKASDAEVIGTVTFRRGAYKFQDKLSRVRRNTTQWLHEFLLLKTGSSCIIASGWGRHLFDIAQTFKSPNGVTNAYTYGWSGNALRMPLFCVEPTGITPVVARIDGPQIPMPAALSHMEAEAFDSVGFSTLFLGVMSNLILTQRGLPANPMCIGNEPHVLNALAQQLHTPVHEVVRNDLGTKALPDLVRYPQHRLGDIINGPPLNIIAVADTHTWECLALRPDWLRVPAKTVMDTRALRSVFNTLPDVLKADIKQGHQWYRSIAAAVLPFLQRHGYHGKVFGETAENLDMAGRLNTAANRVLGLLHYAIRRGAVAPTGDSEIVIKPSEFAGFLAAGLVSVPPIGDMTAALQGAKYLVRGSSTEWVFAEETWNLFSSLYARPL